jgi:hypothetical protein
LKRDRPVGQWQQQKGSVVYHRDKMKNDDLAVIDYKYIEYGGRLQRWYRIAKEETKRKVDEYTI